jgi:hypothetical protein
VLKGLCEPFPLAVQGQGVILRIGRISTGLAARTETPVAQPGLLRFSDGYRSSVPTELVAEPV